MSPRFDQFLKDLHALEPVAVRAIALLIARAEKLPKAEVRLGMIAVAMFLIRKRRLLEVAGELLEEAAQAEPSHMVIDAQANLAELRGDLTRAVALRELAAMASDAPTAADAFRNVWVTQEMASRKSDPSPEGKRKRLDAFLKTAHQLRPKK